MKGNIVTFDSKCSFLLVENVCCINPDQWEDGFESVPKNQLVYHSTSVYIVVGSV